MEASGSGHKGGLVPDTPSTAGTTKFLREDGTWEVPAGGAYTPTLNTIPTTSTTTYTKDGQTINFEIGQFARVANADSPSGYDMYQLYDLTTSGNVTTAKWEKVGYFYDYTTLSIDAVGVSMSELEIELYVDGVKMNNIVTDNNGHATASIGKLKKYKLIFPYVAGFLQPDDVEDTALLNFQNVDVEYEAASAENSRKVYINPVNLSAVLEYSGSLKCV